MPTETIVQLRVGVSRKPLRLARAPLYLRFVMRGGDWNTLDALDQPDDAPQDGETVYAAIQVDVGSVHIDGKRNGRRFAKWMKHATYELLPSQPSQEVMMDWSRWQEFCESQSTGAEGVK